MLAIDLVVAIGLIFCSFVGAFFLNYHWDQPIQYDKMDNDHLIFGANNDKTTSEVESKESSKNKTEEEQSGGRKRAPRDPADDDKPVPKPPAVFQFMPDSADGDSGWKGSGAGVDDGASTRAATGYAPSMSALKSSVVADDEEGGEPSPLEDVEEYPASVGMNNAKCTGPCHRYTRRTLMFIPVVLSTALAGWLTWCIIRVNGISVLEITLLWSSVVLAYHNSVGFWSGTIGFVCRLLLPPITDPDEPCPQTCTGYCCPIMGLPRAPYIGIRTAVVMPIYNESVTRILAGVEATMLSLVRECERRGVSLEMFELFIMSDSRNKEIIEIEKSELARYCQYSRQRGIACTYRVRAINYNKKTGNLDDFMHRFAHAFEAMIVLDADSIMSGKAIMLLSQLLQDNPGVGLIQLQPVPVMQTSTFGRIYQFSANAFCETFAHGYSYWWLDSASFVGHNAIVRIAPFMKHCHLPKLPLPGPLGGHILSHDHAEAAMLRRVGWEVWCIPLGDGSYEEIPTNLLDHMGRDFRWLVGELQHLQLITQPGIDAMARFQLMSGVLSYMASGVWVCTWMLAAQEMARVEWSQLEPLEEQFMANKIELDRHVAMLYLLLLSVALLFTSRVQILILAIAGRESAPQGVCSLVLSMFIEFGFSALCTPMLLTFVNAAMMRILILGHRSAWGAQDRDERALTWGEVLDTIGILAFLAAAAPITYALLGAPWAALWLIPICGSIVASLPLAKYSSGKLDWIERNKFFQTKYEANVPQEVADVHCFMAAEKEADEETAEENIDDLKGAVLRMQKEVDDARLEKSELRSRPSVPSADPEGATVMQMEP
jgi:membrane glycosyltransferase